MNIVGLIHPGAMGASVGSAATHNANDVLWASHGRSPESKARAKRGNLKDCDTVARMVKQSEIILSVCPPHAAEDVANEVMENGFKGIFVEGNAISPARTREIALKVQKNSATFVDGGIIGGPAWEASAGTNFYLSGPEAQTICDIFRGSPLNACVVSNEIGSASALKMVFAAYTKGTTALLTTILAVAKKEGILANLENQWGEAFTDRTYSQVAGSTAKAWRFEGEMREIAATFESAGFSGGFHEAAADIFSRLGVFKETPAQTIGEVLEELV